MSRRSVTAIVIAMLVVGAAAAGLSVLSAVAGEQLWKTKVVEKEHKRSQGYFFENDVQIWITDYKSGKKVVQVQRLQKNGIVRTPFIGLFTYVPDSIEPTFEILDPKGNDVTISLFFPDGRTLFCVEDTMGVPIVVLRQAGTEITIGTRKDWLYAIRMKKTAAEKVGQAWGDKAGAKLIADKLDKLEQLVIKQFEKEAESGDPGPAASAADEAAKP